MDTWILVEQHIYVVNLMLIDQEKHMITHSDNAQFTMTTDVQFIEVLAQNDIGDIYIVKALKEQKKVIADG